MKKNKTDDQAFRFVQMLSAKSIWMETVFIGIILVGMIGSFAKLPFCNLLIVIGFASLAVFYYMVGYAEPQGYSTSNVEKVAMIMRGSATAVALFGILFSLQNWNGKLPLLLVGSISLGLALVAMLYFYFKEQEGKKQRTENLLRTVVIFVLALSKYLY